MEAREHVGSRSYRDTCTSHCFVTDDDSFEQIATCPVQVFRQGQSYRHHYCTGMIDGLFMNVIKFEGVS